MQLVLFVAGIMLIVSAAKGTHTDLGNQLVKDFTGQKGFLVWVLAIGIVGSIGLINDKWKPASHAFLALIIIAMVLNNKGVFAKVSQAVKSSPSTGAAAGATMSGAVDAVRSFLGNPGGLTQ